MKKLVQEMRKGDRRSLSRLLSLVEERNATSFEILEEIWPDTGRAFTIGITGPAGGGKSTLIDQMITRIRKERLKVAVVAVDPTSPFSGGAVLGDRIRMQRHFEDPDVFIRSVGSRGRSGGLSFSARALVQLMDAFGVDVVIVETVGAGQSEIDIVDLADSTVVVLVPEAGDSIQALKAGLLEIADLFVVNKKDRDGADAIARDVQSVLNMKPPQEGEWDIPVLLTESVSGEGVDELWSALKKHRKHVEENGIDSGELLRRRIHELCEVVEARLATVVREKFENDPELKKQLLEERPNLYAIAEKAAERMGSDPIS